MVVYVVVTSFLRNVAFFIYALFGEISILEIPVLGNFSFFAGLTRATPRQPSRLFFCRSDLSKAKAASR